MIRLRSFLGIILCLIIPKLIILAVHIGYKLGMSALLDNCALMEYGNLVTEFATEQAVADINCILITGNVVELGVGQDDTPGCCGFS